MLGLMGEEESFTDQDGQDRNSYESEVHIVDSTKEQARRKQSKPKKRN